MKATIKIVSLLGGLILTGCAVQQSAKTPVKTPDVEAKQVSNIVYTLATDEFQGRNTGSAGIAKAADYISDYFKQNDIKPYYQGYRDNFTIKDKKAFNVLGVIEGNDPTLKDEIVILGAHYDHIGAGKAVNDDTIANGANDNAAGTAAVLTMAKYFSQSKSNKRTLVFALFSAEEMGLLGAKHLAKRMKAEKTNLYAMVNFEMIGVAMKDKPYQAYISGYDKSNMAAKINQYTGQNLIGLLPQAKKFQLFKRSDNYPFYQEFKIPAQTISTFDFTNYGYYHHVDDEAENLDYQHMAKLINQLIPAVESITNTPEQEIKMVE